MRRRLTGQPPSVSFFSFQDIITAVTGIILLIALIMSLRLVEPQLTSARAAPEQLAMRDALRNELASLREKVAGWQAGKAGDLSDEASISANTTNIAVLAESLEAESLRLSGEAGALELPGSLQIDFQGLREEINQQSAELARIREETKETTAAIDAVRAKVEQAEQVVLAELRDTNDVWLIPDRSDTSKEPVIVSVYHDKFLVQPLDAKKPKSVSRSGEDSSDVEKLLEPFKPQDQYVVFYFRPSSLDSFESIKSGAKKLEFEIGYDLVEDDANVQFAKPSGTYFEGQEIEEQIVEETSPIIDITSEVDKRGEPIATGSGFFISSQGHYITNEHVVADGNTFFVAARDGNWRKAKKVASSKEYDLVLLVVEGADHEPMSVADSKTVKLGSSVATVGFPNTFLQGLSPKLSDGKIASLKGFRDDPNEFQISVPIQPGNSGGALFNDKGNVVGVVTSKLDQAVAVELTGMIAENVNYAVKSEKLLEWIAGQQLDKLTLAAPIDGETGNFEDVVEKAERSAAMILVFE
jgi:S1-C subfamily serine protease